MLGHALLDQSREIKLLLKMKKLSVDINVQTLVTVSDQFSSP